MDKKIEEVEEREQLFERARREEISEEDREMIMNTKKEASEENENRKGSVEDFPALT